MLKVKTVLKPIEQAQEFDNEINTLIENGWKMKLRKVIGVHGQINEAFSAPVVPVLYAELEKGETQNFEEVTL